MFQICPPPLVARRQLMVKSELDVAAALILMSLASPPSRVSVKAPPALSVCGTVGLSMRKPSQVALAPKATGVDAAVLVTLQTATSALPGMLPAFQAPATLSAVVLSNLNLSAAWRPDGNAMTAIK